MIYMLRSCSGGVLETPEDVTRAGVFRVGYVIASGQGAGRLILPMPQGQRQWARPQNSAGAGGSPAHELDGTFSVPDEGEQSLHLHVTLAPISDAQAGADADRWCGYHGRALTTGAWLSATIAAARVRADGAALVVAGDELDLTNPLAAVQAALLRVCNVDRAALARAVGGGLGRLVSAADEPTAVGIDPEGVHVRLRSGVARVALDLGGADSAERHLREWLSL